MRKVSSMESPEEVVGIVSIIYSVRDQLTLLAFAGVAGAFFRAILAPEVEWQRRVAQGIGGALSALFLGGFMAQVTNHMFDTGPYSWLAWGFIMGSGGEVAVKFVQDKMLRGK